MALKPKASKPSLSVAPQKGLMYSKDLKKSLIVAGMIYQNSVLFQTLLGKRDHTKKCFNLSTNHEFSLFLESPNISKNCTSGATVFNEAYFK